MVLIINHDELDRELRAITEKELKYKSNPFISERYNNENCKGQDTCLSGDNYMKMGENILLSKHIRFVKAPMHVHTYIEFGYVHSGEFSEVIKNKTVKLKER